MPDERCGRRQDHRAPQCLIGIDAPVAAGSDIGSLRASRISYLRHGGTFPQPIEPAVSLTAPALQLPIPLISARRCRLGKPRLGLVPLA
jgi:hypothetical protein